MYGTQVVTLSRDSIMHDLVYACDKNSVALFTAIFSSEN